MIKDVFQALALHLTGLGMTLPYREEMANLLRENLSQVEAEIALALPTGVIPLQPVPVDDIAEDIDLPRETLVAVLEGMARRGFVFSGLTKDGRKGYALVQRGFGFPQTFYWKGERTPYAKKMAEMVSDYYRRQVLDEIQQKVKTKEYRYIPVSTAVAVTQQGVYDYEAMAGVIRRAKSIAVCHCPCRMRAQLMGKGCDHLMEACLKFDDMADFVIERGFGREITKAEALDIIRKAEEDGLVHFVDNAQGEVKHTCSCCGCCCWNLNPIRRRKVPRDTMIATYFIGKVDEAMCNGCGDCVAVCPVNAITIKDMVAVIDQQWCVGCGLCNTRCTVKATQVVRRADVPSPPPPNFRTLHQAILSEVQHK
ncbi:MAG: 4Fe-4S binding protein [Chloroflexi bacterium]|nr:4Fe-4S binding protein [Chloroflexota bacterium]